MTTMEITIMSGASRPKSEQERAKALCEAAMEKTGINLDAFVRVKPEEAPLLKGVMGSEDTHPRDLRGRVVAIGWLAGTDQVMAQVHTTDPGGSGLNNNSCCTIVQLDCLEEIPPPNATVN